MDAVRARVADLVGRLPKGKSLSDDLWARRHSGILVLLGAHVPVLFLYALHQGVALRHAALEAAIVAVFAWGATALRFNRRLSTIAAVLGLLVCSAVLVHLSGGVIEMHFHFFVVIGIVTLYHDWEPFLVAIAFVVIEHGIGGVFAPDAIYSHADGQANPWAWAALHGGFILAMSSAGLASWRLNEQLIAQVSVRQDALGEAQRVARVGSWDLNLQTRLCAVSEQVHDLTGLPRGVPISFDMLVAHVADVDLEEFVDSFGRALAGGFDGSLDCRWVMPDGEVRWMNIRSTAADVDAAGEAISVSGTVQDITDRMTADLSLRQTLSLLNATLDSTADGILVVDLEGMVTTVNGRFASLWALPPELATTGVEARTIVEHALGVVSDPEEFLRRALTLHTTPDLESHDIIEFRDGKVYERYSIPQRVAGEIVGRVWTCRDVTENKRLQDELAHQAFHDPLTGLANQALFRALVEHAMARHLRTRAPMAVLFIDLDNFKTVNDSLGHNVGDELLVAVSERLAQCIRASDTTARLGGDEFAVLVEEATAVDDATVLAGRIIDELRQPFSVSGKILYVSASIGIAYGHHNTDGGQLLRNADLAMYTAKRRGRGRYEVYEPDMHEAALARLELEADLRGAVARDELIVHYQPIVDMADGSVRGVEALVRWLHPERGLIPPDAFISVAEESDLINEIGNHVLSVACAQAREWQLATNDDSFVMNVNLSPRQLLDEGIVERVAHVLAVTGLPPATLVLEITEGAMVQDTDLAIARLRALKDVGVQLAIDDFGTGYSSLSYLQQFPIDIVKIDRSFIDQLDDGADGSSLAAAIVSMARALQMTTIAEGVETSAQLGVLQGMGCDLAQGFHLAMPTEAPEVSALLEAARTGLAVA